MEHIDRIIHEPVRLRALTLLSGVQAAEFSFLLKVLSLTNGNLSVHMRKLEEAGYVEVTKEFVGRSPRTTYAITEAGREALRGYWRVMEDLRGEGNRE
jgi:DNA-binding transcriptional ArsR family regulator